MSTHVLLCRSFKARGPRWRHLFMTRTLRQKPSAVSYVDEAAELTTARGLALWHRACSTAVVLVQSLWHGDRLCDRMDTTVQLPVVPRAL